MQPPLALALLLTVLNVLFWWFAIFWRHEAVELRARVDALSVLLEVAERRECAEAPPRAAPAAKCVCAPCPPCAPARVCAACPPTTAAISLGDELSEGGLCPRNISDVSVWLAVRDSMPFYPRGGEVRGELYPNASYAHMDTRAGPVGPLWFCDKIATTLEPWIEPSGALDVADVIVGAFSGPNLHFTRAVATSGTWMTQFPNAFIYDVESEPTVPIIGLGERYRFESGAHAYAFVQPMQLLAVRDMYLRRPQGKWFWVVGDDVYAVANTMVRMLEQYDAAADLWLVQYGEPSYNVPAGFDVSAWPNRTAVIDALGKFPWQTGAAGWFISRPVAHKWAVHVERFLSDPALDGNCNCPDVYSGLFLTLLGVAPTVLASEWSHRMSAGSEVSGVFAHVPEPVMWHYIQPRRLIGADQWQEHRKIDRMYNLVARAAQRGDVADARRGIELLVRSYRAFADAKFDVLRRWQATIARLAAKTTQQRTYDIPMEGTVLFDRALDEDWHAAPEATVRRQPPPM